MCVQVYFLKPHAVSSPGDIFYEIDSREMLSGINVNIQGFVDLPKAFGRVNMVTPKVVLYEFGRLNQF